jgi:ABC-type phosphate transport system substrate-binding protein
MRKTLLVVLLAVLLLPLHGPQSAAQEGAPAFKIVVNAANPATSETKAALSKLFLKKVREWGASKEKVTPFDLDEKSETRRAFSDVVHGKSISAIKSYWQRMIFSGRDVPPDELAGEDEMLRKVAADKSAVGYVSARTPLVEGVRELRISDL